MEPTPARKIRVLVADNSVIHSQLLANALQQDPDFVAVNWDANSSSLVSAVVTQKVDVLAICSSFGGHTGAGLKIVQELRSLHPKSKTIVLLDSSEAQLVTDAFRAGARGVFNRESSVEMFCKCLRSVDRGEIWADNRGVSLAVDALASIPVMRTVDSGGLNLLSKREFEVVQCVVQGMTNREIAQRLGLSQHTVKNYLFRVFDKLGVSSRVELLFITLRPGHEAVGRRSQAPVGGEALRQMFQGDGQNGAAFDWLEKTAEQGVPGAQFCLAEALVARADPAESVNAYMWFLIAAERGRQAREQLAKKLTAAQIEQAQQRAGIWFRRAKQAVSLSAGGLQTEDEEPAAPRTTPIPQQIAQLGRSRTESPRRAEPERTRPASEPVLNYGSA